jgi:hypothetical protein
MNYELESIALVTTFAHYTQNRRLPAELFNHPDYISLHAANIQDFENKLKETESRAEQITVIEAEDRFVATVKLSGALGVADLGRVRWLEIVEPTQEELMLGLITGDRVGFYCDDFEKARHVLSAQHVPFSISEYPAPALKVEYSDRGDEFRISTVSIQTLVQSDIETERATIVRLAA